MTVPGVLLELRPGMPLLFGGNRVTYVSEALARAFEPGDRLIVVQTTGDILHIPAAQQQIADTAVGRAREAFADLRTLPEERAERFYDEFGSRLADDGIWSKVVAANDDDVVRARARGRSTTRLLITPSMRNRMLDGLGRWRAMVPSRYRTTERVEHMGWKVEQVRDGVGVVGFVFEGRPNVLVDATGILRTGNTTALRIGSDALGTARVLVSLALAPALAAAGLPEGAVTLIESTEHAAGWALFANTGLSLAIARGSGATVEQLGAIARQAGVPVSLHGTGGAWMIVDETAEPAYLRSVVYHSLDRKVCNTLNVACFVEASVETLLPVFLAAVAARGTQLGHGYKLHVTPDAMPYVPHELFERSTTVVRAGGPADEPIAEPWDVQALGHEWEWERTPEVTVHITKDVDEAVGLFNQHSPRFIASLISQDQEIHDRFFRSIDAPFVGNGVTRWVDGQFALNRPELGLTNWQHGRLLSRGGILTGDGVYTLRLRVHQTDPEVHQ